MSAAFGYLLEHQGRNIELAEGELVVGRSRKCDVSIREASISRQHVKLTVGAGLISVQDLGSSNGTFHNGSRVRDRAELLDGDHLGLGEAKLIVRIQASADSAARVEPGDATRVLAEASAQIAAKVEADSTADEEEVSFASLAMPQRFALGDAQPDAAAAAPLPALDEPFDLPKGLGLDDEMNRSADLSERFAPDQSEAAASPSSVAPASPAFATMPMEAITAEDAAALRPPKAAPDNAGADAGSQSGPISPPATTAAPEPTSPPIATVSSPQVSPSPSPTVSSSPPAATAPAPTASPSSPASAAPAPKASPAVPVATPTASSPAPAASSPAPAAAGDVSTTSPTETRAVRPAPKPPRPESVAVRPCAAKPGAPAPRRELPATEPLLTGIPSEGELLDSVSSLDQSLFLPPKPAEQRKEAVNPFQARLARAGFWRRFLAVLIDQLWITGIALGVTFARGGPFSLQGQQLAGLVAMLLGLLVPLVGWSLWGTTPGKRLCGLWVCRMNGQKGIGLGRTLVRLIGTVLSALPLGLGFLWVAGSEKRGWHDRMAGTFVGRHP